MLLGREREQARIDAMLRQARTGVSGALVVRGEPGIGKSALLHYAIEQAESMTVLLATGVESESELPFSGLSELLHPMLALINEIPQPQAGALAGALAVGPPVAQDRFTICAATLSLLAISAEQRPVLAVVDDAHWLDASSREALLFAARRLHADRTLMLFAARLGEPVALESPGVPELTLQGIDQEACNALLIHAGASHVSMAMARRILEATRGNPLAILEIPRTLSADQLSGAQPVDEPLPSGPGIQRSFERQIARLVPEIKLGLLVAAASQSGSTAEVRRACDRLGIARAALERAESAGLITNDGLRIQFRHPLMRAAVYYGAPAPARRQVHQALAEALADEPLASRRAWHLAVAAEGEDEQVAANLEQAAREARERSGHSAAASAFERAARLTPEPEDRARRLLEAGSDAYVAGQSDWAISLLQEALTHASGTTLRTEIEHTRGRVEMWTGSPVEARKILLAAADAIEPHDPAKAALMLVDVSTNYYHQGDPDEGVLAPVLAICRRAYDLGSRVGGIPLAAASGSLGQVLVLLGRVQEGYPLVLECLTALSGADSLWLEVQLGNFCIVLAWLEEFDRARQSLERAISRARALSAPGALPYPLCFLSDVDFRVGRWSASHAGAAEAAQLAKDLGQTIPLSYALLRLGWVEARLGRERDCRERAATACDLFEPSGTTITTYADAIVGSLEFGLGRYGEAIERLEAVSRFCDREGIVEPAMFQHMPDLIESYLLGGARAKAEAALDTFQGIANRTGRTWALATAARCRGMLADESFDADFDEALHWHERTPTPFDRARTELCYGQRLRRARRRAEARLQLHSALETFERLGAEPWADRARRELDATGQSATSRRRPATEQLTLQELQVALKVAVGATNREVASELFLSPKTIEAHLGHIYTKLGIRSRTELAHRFAQEGDKPLARLGNITAR